jgi:hypothetical protein
MTPHGFVAKWRASPKDGQRHSQSHFNDLCALLGVPDPATAGDPGFGFEKARQGDRRQRLGRRLEARLLWLGVQGPRPQPR